MKQKKMAETAVAVKAGNAQDMDVVDVLGTAKLQFCSGTCRYCQYFLRLRVCVLIIEDLETKLRKKNMLCFDGNCSHQNLLVTYQMQINSI